VLQSKSNATLLARNDIAMAHHIKQHVPPCPRELRGRSGHCRQTVGVRLGTTNTKMKADDRERLSRDAADSPVLLSGTPAIANSTATPQSRWRKRSP